MQECLDDAGLEVCMQVIITRVLLILLTDPLIISQATSLLD